MTSIAPADRELSSADASAALEHWFKRPRLTLGEITAAREGRWVVLHFKFRRAPWSAYTVKLSTAWAHVLKQRLDAVLG